MAHPHTHCIAVISASNVVSRQPSTAASSTSVCLVVELTAMLFQFRLMIRATLATATNARAALAGMRPCVALIVSRGVAHQRLNYRSSRNYRLRLRARMVQKWADEDVCFCRRLNVVR
jgi:hypothetical protein